MDTPNTLENLDGYRRLFTDAAFWSPYVREVCRRHHLVSTEGREPTISMGVPGTCPVFIMEERWVVKFFGRLFDGGQCFQVEHEAGRLVGRDPAIRTARLVASGALNDPRSDWPWPYLIYDYIPGVSIGEVREQVCLEDQLRMARELGDTVRRLHALPLENAAVFPDSYEPYLEQLKMQRPGVTQRQREWGSLPAHLLEQIDAYLPPVETLVDRTRPPHLIHADLTRDHLLGRVENGRWTTLALIDFGDARTGDLLYELAALHLDLFAGDQRLLAAFFETYGLSVAERADLPRKALSTALLHQFDVFFALPEALRHSPTLEALADGLWKVKEI